MTSKTTKLTKQGYQDAFASLVSFAAIVMVSVYETACSTDDTEDTAAIEHS